MAPSRRTIVKFIGELSKHENLKLTVHESSSGALVVGGGAFVGSLLGGPVGLAIGGTLAAIYTGISGLGSYKSVYQVYTEDMTMAQKDELINTLTNVLSEFGNEDVVALLAIISNDLLLKQKVLAEIGKFFFNELQLTLT